MVRVRLKLPLYTGLDLIFPLYCSINILQTRVKHAMKNLLSVVVLRTVRM